MILARMMVAHLKGAGDRPEGCKDRGKRRFELVLPEDISMRFL